MELALSIGAGVAGGIIIATVILEIADKVEFRIRNGKWSW